MNIFSYTDFRVLLKDHYESQKAKNPVFSYRLFSRLAGLKGPGYLKMVIDGKRGLTPPTILKFVKAMHLSPREGIFFENLVLYNQAQTEREKDLYFDRLLDLMPHTDITRLEKDQFEYVTNKNLVTIREMTALPDFKGEADWIAARLNPPTTPQEARQALEILGRLGLLKKDSRGRLKHSGKTVRTPPDIVSLEIMNYHRTILAQAKDAILRVPKVKREITSMTIPLSLKTVEKIKKILRKTQEEIAHVVNKGDRDFNEIFQINFQMFPVTEKR